MNLKKIISAVAASALVASALVIPASAEDTYKAGLTFQTKEYHYRDSLDQTDMGVAGKIDEDYDEHDFKDVEFSKDGTYTVSISGIPEIASGYNMLFFITNMPAAKADTVKIEITGVKAGSSTDFDLSKQLSLEDEAKNPETDPFLITLINDYNDDMKDNNGIIANGTFTDIEVTFKVTGLSGNANEDTTTDETGDSTDAATDNTTSAAGDVNQPTTDKNSPDTGVEGVAVVAGLAVIAAGAIVVAKKRK